MIAEKTAEMIAGRIERTPPTGVAEAEDPAADAAADATTGETVTLAVAIPPQHRPRRIFSMSSTP
jgi:hypothetical protein